MRTIAILIFLIWASLDFKGQTVLDAVKQQSEGACVLNYTDAGWTMEYNDPSKQLCPTIAIASLPAMSQANTPLNLFITVAGTYTLKKDADLAIPDDYTVVVEDLLTGQYYNLKTQESYTFKMNRGFNQTLFVLEIS